MEKTKQLSYEEVKTALKNSSLSKPQLDYCLIQNHEFMKNNKKVYLNKPFVRFKEKGSTYRITIIWNSNYNRLVAVRDRETPYSDLNI